MCVLVTTITFPTAVLALDVRPTDRRRRLTERRSMRTHTQHSHRHEKKRTRAAWRVCGSLHADVRGMRNAADGTSAAAVQLSPVSRGEIQTAGSRADRATRTARAVVGAAAHGGGGAADRAVRANE